MEQISQKIENIPSKNILKEFKLKINEKEFLTKVELVDERIRITFLLELSTNKWSEIFSIEQLQKLNLFYAQLNISEAFQCICDQIQSNDLTIKFNDKIATLTFIEKVRNLTKEINIPLKQEQIDTTIAIQGLNQIILDLKRQVESQINFNKNINQQYVNLLNENETHKQVIKQLQSESQELKQKLIQFDRNFEKINNYFQNSMKVSIDINSDILSRLDIKNVTKWINPKIQRMKLQKLYKATEDGFQIAKFYEKCSNKGPTLVCIKTQEQKRFGGYTELNWQQNSSYVAQNPNKTFIFSLDLNKKYTSNDKNCTQSIYGSGDRFAFGLTSHGIGIFNDSNKNERSHSNGGHTYGKEEGLAATELAGKLNFTTLEIEVFQIIIQ